MLRTGARRWLLLAAVLITATLTLGGSAAASGRAAAPASVVNATCVRGNSSGCPIRITFARGAYSGHRSTTISSVTQRRWFVVRARAGQNMIVVVHGAGPTRGIVHFPNGEADGQPGGRVFDDVLPVSGDYRIEVTESLMAEAWRGRITVIVFIF